MGYPKERREAVLKKMLPPNNQPISVLAREEGISESTLYNRRKAARAEGRLLPDGDTTPAGWSSADKFAAVRETAGVNEVELSEYCRERGLYPAQIQQWKEACARANDWDRSQNKRLQETRRADEKRIRKLEKELRKKEKVLAETASPAGAVKKARSDLGGRGRMTSGPDRQRILELVAEAERAGVRRSRIAQQLGLNMRTLKRWQEQPEDGRPRAQRPAPANRLTEAERQEVLRVCNLLSYAHLPPSQIVSRLADEGIYLASESSFYRILREADQLHRRGKAQPPKKRHKPEAHQATAPNQVWSWDINWLASAGRGRFYRLYLVLDLYSRKIVAWEVHETESAEQAARLIQQACLREGIRKEQLVLHADNGGSMKGATMLATLQKLGVVPSFSRPSVSDDNPYSEALFRTLKYIPDYPTHPFESLESTRRWVLTFVRWYNKEHRHSAIRFVTPEQRHRGEDQDILKARKAVYEQARKAHPERWTGSIRNWEPVTKVWLNPDPEQSLKQRQLEPLAA